MVRGISVDRWSCPRPDCQETLVRSTLTDDKTWRRQLTAMQKRHGQQGKHRKARR